MKDSQTKRVELSDVSSNLLLVSSVMLALAPLLLGDKLILIAQNGLRELAVFVNEMSTLVMRSLS